MGAWGVGTFENDDALDWVFDLKESSRLSVIREALAPILEQDGSDLETGECCCALAAAEVVAALRGKAASKLPKDVTDWLKANTAAPDKALINLAAQAVRKIGEQSELKELWEDAGGLDAAAWADGVSDLLQRLA